MQLRKLLTNMGKCHRSPGDWEINDHFQLLLKRWEHRHMYVGFLEMKSLLSVVHFIYLNPAIAHTFTLQSFDNSTDLRLLLLNTLLTRQHFSIPPFVFQVLCLLTSSETSSLPQPYSALFASSGLAEFSASSKQQRASENSFLLLSSQCRRCSTLAPYLQSSFSCSPFWA